MGEPRLPKMHLWVDDAGEHVEPLGVENLGRFAGIDGAHLDDAPVADGDGSGDSSGRGDAHSTAENGIVHGSGVARRSHCSRGGEHFECRSGTAVAHEVGEAVLGEEADGAGSFVTGVVQRITARHLLLERGYGLWNGREKEAEGPCGGEYRD